MPQALRQSACGVRGSRTAALPGDIQQATFIKRGEQWFILAMATTGGFPVSFVATEAGLSNLARAVFQDFRHIYFQVLT